MTMRITLLPSLKYKALLRKILTLTLTYTLLPAYGQMAHVQYHVSMVIIGPRRVRKLLLAAGRNKGGHYFRYFFPLLFLPPQLKTTEGVVVGFHIFAWAPEKKY